MQSWSKYSLSKVYQVLQKIAEQIQSSVNSVLYYIKFEFLLLAIFWKREYEKINCKVDSFFYIVLYLNIYLFR